MGSAVNEDVGGLFDASSTVTCRVIFLLTPTAFFAPSLTSYIPGSASWVTLTLSGIPVLLSSSFWAVTSINCGVSSTMMFGGLSRKHGADLSKLRNSVRVSPGFNVVLTWESIKFLAPIS